MTDLTDAAVTELLGAKCPDCGWRGGRHRPPGDAYPACPRWVPDDGDTGRTGDGETGSSPDS